MRQRADCVHIRAPYDAPMHRFPTINRRTLLIAALNAAAVAALIPDSALASSASEERFRRWVAHFRARALSRGISEKTYDRVMNAVKPDTAVYDLIKAQPEFTEQMWQYINRRCSEWRVDTGKERAKEYAKLLGRIERDYGVDRYVMLGLWGMES